MELVLGRAVDRRFDSCELRVPRVEWFCSIEFDHNDLAAYWTLQRVLRFDCPMRFGFGEGECPALYLWDRSRFTRPHDLRAAPAVLRMTESNRNTEVYVQAHTDTRTYCHYD